MVQVIEQTRDEKISMYMKCTKRELVEMVINCNEAVARLGLKAADAVKRSED